MQAARKRPIRVLMSKLGMDGHDRGLLVVTLALRDAGMEVIYLGTNRSVDEIAQVALQESVDIVGVSSLSDAHRRLAPKLVQRLKDKGMGHVPVVLGGLILDEDIPAMKEVGITEVFTEGVKLDEMVKYFEQVAATGRNR